MSHQQRRCGAPIGLLGCCFLGLVGCIISPYLLCDDFVMEKVREKRNKPKRQQQELNRPDVKSRLSSQQSVKLSSPLRRFSHAESTGELQDPDSPCTASQDCDQLQSLFFHRLPAEIRAQIYHMVFTNGEDTFHIVRGEDIFHVNKKRLGFLRCLKTIDPFLPASSLSYCDLWCWGIEERSSVFLAKNKDAFGHHEKHRVWKKCLAFQQSIPKGALDLDRFVMWTDGDIVPLLRSCRRV